MTSLPKLTGLTDLTGSLNPDHPVRRSIPATNPLAPPCSALLLHSPDRTTPWATHANTKIGAILVQ